MKVKHKGEHFINLLRGVRWPSGRASDSELRGHGFDPHKDHSFHHVVSLSKTHKLHRILVKTQEAMAPSRHD